MLEFVLAFPLILTLMLACMQFAHMWMAKQVVHYAAYCAARAALAHPVTCMMANSESERIAQSSTMATSLTQPADAFAIGIGMQMTRKPVGLGSTSRSPTFSI